MAKKNRKNIVIVIVIIVLFLYFFQQPFKKLETASIIAFDTYSECESKRQQYIDYGYQCVSSSCIIYTQAIVDCIASCYGGRSTPDMVGSPSCLRIREPCDSITDSSDICSYYCYYGFYPPTSQQCNTLADDSPYGNCDGTVQASEVTALAFAWISTGAVQASEVTSAAYQWITGGTI